MVRINKQIHIIFRMDDYSAISDKALELKIIEIFQKKKGRVTFGVIPFVCEGDERDSSTQNLIPLTREKGSILKKKIESGVLDIALHGYSHQVNSSKEPSEFAGLDYGTQLERLTKGRQALKELTGTFVKIFIPPWNQYDKSTLKALEELHFTTLSAGWKGVAQKGGKINFIPATCGLSDLHNAIDAAKSATDNPLIVVLFHHYDFIESKDERGAIPLKGFSDLLDWVVSQVDLKVVSLEEAGRFIADLSSNRFIAIEKWRFLDKLMPEKFREKKPVLIYHEASIWHKTFCRLAFFYGFLFLIFIFIAYYGGRFIFKRIDFFLIPSVILCFLITICITSVSLRNMDISPKGLTLSLASIGGFIGMLMQYLLK